MELMIGRRRVGPGEPCLIVAEVGLAHDGSLSQAHAYIEAARAAGADAVKYQCHLSDATGEWRVRPRWPQDSGRQEYWGRTGFSGEQWAGLARHCAEEGLIFICSPFSPDAVKMLDSLVEVWKLPSGRVASLALLDAVGLTSKPVLVSTGMSTQEEATFAVTRLKEHGCAVGLMQCTSLYPCPPEYVGLGHVARWGGFSDHSGTIYPGIAAAALGCQVLEVHVVFSRAQGGFDVDASITVDELVQLVRGVRFVEQAMARVDKDRVAAELQATRRVFM